MLNIMRYSVVYAAVTVPEFASGADAPAPFPHVPTTISREARTFLKNAAPPPAKNRTEKDWEDDQATVEKRGKADGGQLVREFGAEIEVTELGGVTVNIVTPKNYDKANGESCLFFIHGGGYCFNSAESSYTGCVPLSAYTGLRTYSVDYRLAPQYPFPKGLEDCLAAYRETIRTFPPRKIGVFGHSAGGSLLLSMLLEAEKEKLPMPGAVVSFTPWADLAKIGDSYFTLEGRSPVLHYDPLEAIAKAYVGDHDPSDPRISPVYGHYTSDFPPTLIQTGTRDLFLSNCVRLYRNMKDGGVRVELSVWEGMWHGFTVIPNATFPEARRGNEEAAEFFRRHLKLRPTTDRD